MNSSTTTSSSDIELGYTVLGYVIDSIGWCIAMSAALMCSSWLMTILVGAIMGALMYLLSQVIYLFAVAKTSVATAERIGTNVRSLQARVTSLFTKKVEAA